MDSVQVHQTVESKHKTFCKKIKLKLKRGWLLQMDSDPKHTTKSFRWPSEAPVGNISRNLWIDLKRFCINYKGNVLFWHVCLLEISSSSTWWIVRMSRNFDQRGPNFCSFFVVHTLCSCTKCEFLQLYQNSWVVSQLNPREVFFLLFLFTDMFLWSKDPSSVSLSGIGV